MLSPLCVHWQFFPACRIRICAWFRNKVRSHRHNLAHDSHNICVAGSSDEDMAVAVNTLISMQGGLVVVKNKKGIFQVAFPIAGLLSNLPAKKLSAQLRMLAEAACTIGCTLPEPFQQLSFLALPVIPHLKLTAKGLWDVDVFQHIKA